MSVPYVSTTPTRRLFDSFLGKTALSGGVTKKTVASCVLRAVPPLDHCSPSDFHHDESSHFISPSPEPERTAANTHTHNLKECRYSWFWRIGDQKRNPYALHCQSLSYTLTGLRPRHRPDNPSCVIWGTEQPGACPCSKALPKRRKCSIATDT